MPMTDEEALAVFAQTALKGEVIIVKQTGARMCPTG
tara:strand:- start:1610 stop:1717 length:108 start_codon:yes stop_codon:yes gene_type:complete